MGLPDPQALLKKNHLQQERARSQAFREQQAARLRGERVPPPELPNLPKLPPTGQTFLIIGDSHCEPGVPNHRYDWLGRFLTDHKPDVVVDIGDWWDMPSLSRYEKAGSRYFEGRRYWADIEVGIDAQERVRWQLEEYNKGTPKKKRYEPRQIRTLGNHEYRILRLLEDEPRWDGMLGTHDLMSAEFGWEEYPFKQELVLGGIALCHYFPSGVMGRAIAGEHIAHTIVRRQFHSAIQGHNHMLDYCQRTDATGKKIQAMSAGCYFHHELEWAGPKVNQMYARGLLLLRNVHDGEFDPEWWGIDRIQREYS